MRVGARNKESSEIKPKSKNIEPPTRRTLLMMSPGRKNKTGISISPSRLDPSLSDSMSKDQGGSSNITDCQRALVKKMEQLVGEHHYRRNSGVSSQNSLTQSNGNTSSNASNLLLSNKMLSGPFTQRPQQFTPQEPGTLSASVSARNERQTRNHQEKPMYANETRILKVPQSAQQIHLNLNKSEEKATSPAFSPSPRFLDFKEQASDGNQFYKRLFDRFEEKSTTRKKSPYSKTPDAVLRNISSARESATSQDSTRKRSLSPGNGKLHQSSQIANQNKSTGADLSEDKGHYVPPTFESDLNSFLDGQLEADNSNILKESDLQPQIQVSSPGGKKSRFEQSSERCKSTLKSKIPKKLLPEPSRGRTISFKNKKRFFSPDDSADDLFNQNPGTQMLFPPGKMKTHCFADLSSSIEIQAPQPSMESIDVSFEESCIQKDALPEEGEPSVPQYFSPIKQPHRCGSAGPSNQSFNAFKSSFNKKTNKTERKPISHRKSKKTSEADVKAKDKVGEKESRLKPFKEKKATLTTSRCSTPKVKAKVRSNIFAKKRVSEGELSLSFSSKKSPIQDKMQKSNSMTKLFLEKMGADTASTCLSFRSESAASESTMVPSARGRPSHQGDEKKCSTFKDMKNKKHNFKQKKKMQEKESQNIHFALFKSESNVKYGCIPVAESVITYPEKAFKNFVSSLREGDDVEETRFRPATLSEQQTTEQFSSDLFSQRPCSTQPDRAISPISRSLATMLAEEKKMSILSAQVNSPQPKSSYRKDSSLDSSQKQPLQDSHYDDLEFQMMENLSKQNSFKALQEAMLKPQELGTGSASIVRRNKVSPLDLPFSSSLKGERKVSSPVDQNLLTPQRLDTGYSFGEDALFGNEDNQEKIERTPRLSSQDLQEKEEVSLKEDTNEPGTESIQDHNCELVKREKSPDTLSEYNLLEPVADKDFPGRLNLSPSPAYQSESETLPKEDKNQDIEIVAQILKRKVSGQSSNASRSNNIPHELSFGLPLFLQTLKSVASSTPQDHNMTSKISIFTEPAKLIQLASPLLTPRDQADPTEGKEECQIMDKEGADTDRVQIMSIVTTPKVEKLAHKKSEPESEDQGNKGKHGSGKGKIQEKVKKADKGKDELNSLFSGLMEKVGMSQIQAFHELRNLAASMIQRNYRRSVTRRKLLISLKRMALTSKEIKEQSKAYNFKMGSQEVVICREQSTQTEQEKKCVSTAEYIWRAMLLKQLCLSAYLVAKGYKWLERKGEMKV